jgi:metallo-beta-lactamase class B
MPTSASSGFERPNIKLLLNSHAHYDHASGLNALQRFTGARVLAGRLGVRALEQGRPAVDDPQAAFDNNRFPPVAQVRGVADGEVTRVGDVAITAHATPGHTPGGTTWSWRSCEGTRCLDVVYADSVSPVAAPGYSFSGDRTHRSIVASFRKSITSISQLPCDILIGAHPVVSDLDGKLKRRTAKSGGTDPFVDPDACRALAASAMKALDARLDEEARRQR